MANVRPLSGPQTGFVCFSSQVCNVKQVLNTSTWCRKYLFLNKLNAGTEQVGTSTVTLDPVFPLYINASIGRLHSVFFQHRHSEHSVHSAQWTQTKSSYDHMTSKHNNWHGRWTRMSWTHCIKNKDVAQILTFILFDLHDGISLY